MRVALTGTPGTGKTSVGSKLSRQGHRVVDLAALAEEKGFVRHPAKGDGPGIVDVEALRKASPPGKGLVFLSSHFSHLMDVDIVVVLRCSPKVLASRLRSRHWDDGKIRDNVEAEAIDLITIEAMERCGRVYEVDTTSIDAKEAARQIIEIVNGAVEGHEAGRIDWSEEILTWY